MSLNQLTANYTDSEDEDSKSANEPSASGDEEFPISEKEMSKETPNSPESKSSAANTPKKRIGKLVSYTNEDDDEELPIDDDDDDDDDENNTEPDEILNSEPMDTGTEDGEDEKSDEKDLGIKLPPPPPGKCSSQLQEKISSYLSKMKQGTDYNAKIQNTKEFRNPSIYEKLIEHLGFDEMGSNYPLQIFDPHCWGKESFYDELGRVQREEMDKREKERKEKTKVDIISGTKKPAEEELKKRKSRFDQGHPSSGALGIKASAPSLLAAPVSTTSKTTISAFGALKKPK